MARKSTKSNSRILFSARGGFFKIMLDGVILWAASPNTNGSKGYWYLWDMGLELAREYCKQLTRYKTFDVQD